MNRKGFNFASYETGLGIIGGFTIAFAVVLLIRIFSPTVCELALEKLQSEFNRICNTAVLDYLDSEKTDYEDIIIIERSDGGEIRGMTSDVAKVNRMKSEISLAIQSEIDKIEEVKVDFPTSGFFGLGGGIKIPVKLMSVSLMEAEIVSSFESVGINQTRLNVNAIFNIKGRLLALGQGQEATVKSEVPVLMTVVVGNVPNTYVSVKK